MTLRVSTIKITKTKSYTKWNSFCEESLEFAKQSIKEFKNERRSHHNSLMSSLNQIVQGEAVLGSIIQLLGLIGWAGLTALVNILLAGGIITVVGLVVTAGTFLSNPVGIVAAITGGGVLSAACYQIYKNKKLVIKVHKVLTKEKVVFDNHQPGYKYNKIINELFVKSVQQVISKVLDTTISVEDDTLPISPVCLCGEILSVKNTNNCYGNEFSCVICDLCDKTISNDVEIFHCNNGKTNIHSRGYDICIKCARIYNGKLKRYHALVVVDSTMTEKVSVADILKELFNELNYHTVKVLEKENATKQNVFQYLHKLSKLNQNDVIVICWQAHGKFSSKYKFTLNGKDLSDEEVFGNLINNNNNGNFSLQTRDVFVFANTCYSGNINLKKSLKKQNYDDNNSNNNNNNNVDEDYEKFKLYLKSQGVNEETLNKLQLKKNNNKFKNDLLKWQKEYKKVCQSIIVLSSTTKDDISSSLPIVTFVNIMKESKKNNIKLTPKMLCEKINKLVEDKNKIGFGFTDNTDIYNNNRMGNFANKFSIIPAVKRYE